MAHHVRTMTELKEHIWRLAEAARNEIEQSYGSIATAAAGGNQHAYEHAVNLRNGNFVGPDPRSAKPFDECRFDGRVDASEERGRAGAPDRRRESPPSGCHGRPPGDL